MKKRGGLRQKDDFHRSSASALLFAHVTISLGQPIKGGGGNTTIQKKMEKEKKCSRGPLYVAEEKEITHTKNITQEMK